MMGPLRLMRAVVEATNLARKCSGVVMNRSTSSSPMRFWCCLTRAAARSGESGTTSLRVALTWSKQRARSNVATASSMRQKLRIELAWPHEALARSATI